MFCRQCGTEVANDCLVCPSCNSSVAIMQQKDVIEGVTRESKAALSKVFKSGAFLSFAIGVTFVFFTYLLSFLPSILAILDWFDPLVLISLGASAGLLVIPLLDFINVWKVYSHRDGRLVPSQINSFRHFSTLWIVLYRICTVLIIISGAIATILSLIGVRDFEDFLTTTFIIASVIVGLVFFFNACVSIYSNINSSFENTSRCYASATYKPMARVSKPKFYILASFFVIISVALALLASSVSTAIYPSSLIMLANGLYLIFSAVLISKLEEVSREYHVKVTKETNTLQALEKQTSAYRNELYRKEREEQERIERAEREERERAEAKTREMLERELLAKERSEKLTQEMLLQQMMMFMKENMKNNGSSGVNLEKPDSHSSSNSDDLSDLLKK